MSMSKELLMPPQPSISPLARQAARNLHQLELISGTPGWDNWFFRQNFWCTRGMMAVTPDEAAVWLPAIALAVSREDVPDVLVELARWPLPEPLPPEALPWRDRLIQVWEQYPAATDWETSLRLFALVRLDRRMERLPEWLTEARRALDLEPPNCHLRLAALAGWRPRPGACPPHMGSTGLVPGADMMRVANGLLPAWLRFWEELYQVPTMEGVIAAAALLHLAEGGWFPGGFSRERLREEFRRRVRHRFTVPEDWHALRILLSSIPAGSPAPGHLRQDVRKWLQLTRQPVDPVKREAVWGMLVSWQQEGILERSGRGRLREPPLLLPDLARALEWERDSDVLQSMAGYVPGAAEVSAHPEAARAVVAWWQTLSHGDAWRVRLAAWVARWNLWRARIMTDREQAQFDRDYTAAVGTESNGMVLAALAQTGPPGSFPLTAWVRRLSDGDDACRLAAGLAMHRWLGEVMEGANGEWEGRPAGRPYEQRVASSELPLATHQYGQFPELPLRLAITRRQMRQALRRAGQDIGDGTVAPFVNLPPEVLPDFRRLREIETALAAGHLPLPPDTGTGNRLASCAVSARLPEAHPRTDRTGITGRMAGSESTTRHPFHETVCHK